MEASLSPITFTLPTLISGHYLVLPNLSRVEHVTYVLLAVYRGRVWHHVIIFVLAWLQFDAVALISQRSCLRYFGSVVSRSFHVSIFTTVLLEHPSETAAMVMHLNNTCAVITWLLAYLSDILRDSGFLSKQKYVKEKEIEEK